MTRFDERAQQAMRRALELAARGLETTHPNPRVGCVIVRDGTVVGEGWHQRPGEPHAEVLALRAAGAGALGATAYVTLEPCSHHGRTPPCVDALIAARVGRVVYAARDPNPRVDGRGAERLRAAGIEVDSGLMEHEALELNAGFAKRMLSGLPWVRLKLAMSLDGHTALASGASQWLTGERAREDVQRWRAQSSMILTGIGTVLADDPRLDVRVATARAQPPTKVVLDTTLRTPPTARLLASAGEVLILTAVADGARRAALESRGVRVECVPTEPVAADGAPESAGGRLDLRAALIRLGAAEANEVLVECGATLAGELIRLSLVDELLLYVAPLLLGPQARPLAQLPPLADIAAARRFRLLDALMLGGDVRLRLRPPLAPEA